MDRLRAQALRLLTALAAGLALAAFLALALGERARTALRRRRGARPRLIWGPVPIVSLRYWSEAMRRAGYQSMTCVTGTYAINERKDFDVYRDEFCGGSALSALVCDYRFFAWTLRRGDVFIRFFDGGFLRWTPLQWCEGPLLRLAGKELIVSPYGSDIAVSGQLSELEEPLFADYPSLREQSPVTRRWVEHTSRWATLLVRHHQPGYLPRYDATLPNHFAIDFDEFGEEPSYSEADGEDEPVTVLHAPNHRHIKGSEHFIRAVEELREEGLAVELQLIQRRPNSEVRAMLAGADIAADQLLSPGYAMFSIEAMASGRPVLNNIRTLPADLLATEVLEGCPAIDTDPARVKDELRSLVQDPDRRREIGLAGREFVHRFHSIDALGREWEALVMHAWAGVPLPERLRPEPY